MRWCERQRRGTVKGVVIAGGGGGGGGVGGETFQTLYFVTKGTHDVLQVVSLDFYALELCPSALEFLGAHLEVLDVTVLALTKGALSRSVLSRSL